MLRFIDSASHYSTTTNGAGKWTQYPSSNYSIQTSGGPRGGGFHRRTNWLGSGGYLSRTLDNQATFIAGFRIRISAFPSTAAAQILALTDAASVQADYRLNLDGTIQATRNGTVLGATPVVISSLNAWFYLEFKTTINNTSGVVEIRSNGSSTPVLSLSGVNTRNTANNFANAINFFNNSSGSSGAANIDICDIVVCDNTGSVNNSFLGDCRVDAHFPSGNGNSSGMTGSDGNSTDNYLLVDDTAPNDDTDYVLSSAVGQKDTYVMTGMSHTPSSIFGIQTFRYAKNSDAGARSGATVIRSSGSDTDLPSAAQSLSYLHYLDVKETNPATGVAWTKAEINALEVGPKVAA